MTTVAKTVSATTGTFTTPQLWEDGAPANLTTSNNWAAGSFAVAAFIQGETVTGTGITGGKMLDTDSTGAGNGTYITVGTTTTPAAGITITGSTSGATCVISGSANVGVIWQGQQKNEEFSSTGTRLSIGGSTTSSTCYKEYTTFAGASFADNANKLTNALCYNASNGAALKGTSNLTYAVIAEEQFARISKIQVSATGTDGACLKNTTAFMTNLLFKDMILEGKYSGDLAATGIVATASKMVNCLVIQRASAAHHIIDTGTSITASFYNCTFVAPDDLATAPASIFDSGASGTVTVQNCGLFAGADKPTTAGSATFNFTTCYGDDSTPASGITTATYANEFQNVNDATRDFRLKAGAAQLDTGTTDATNAPTDIVGTTRPQGSAYDVGCWELVVAGTAVPVFYHHYQQARMT